MAEYKVNIKSSLLNSDDFKNVKASIEKVSAIDHKEDFRVNLIEYINDTSTNDDDMFFYDMLEFVNFLNPGSDAVAYTTPDCLIWLNAPSDKVGEKYRQWDFIYDHECLHQLWETFEVEKEIEKNEGSCNHKVLNIASDCVINDYLSFYRKKEAPEFGITPEVIEKEFGVKYDRKVDTQYTLYIKINKVVEENKELMKKLQQMAQQQGDQQGDQQGNQQGDQQGDQQGNQQGGQQGGQQGNQQGGQQGGQQGNQQGNQNDQQGGGNGDKDGQGNQQGGQQGGGNGNDKDGQQGNQNAQQGGGNGNDKDGQQGNQQGGGKGDKDGQGNQNGQQDGGKGDKDGQQGDQQGNQQGGGKGKGGKQAGNEAGETPIETDVNVKELAKRAKAIIDRYKNKISGAIGKFTEKCKESKALKDTGLSTKTTGRGVQSWNEKMNGAITAYVKNRVFQKKREWETTYTRMKRGAGVVKFGQPISPGKRIKTEKLLINSAFYIDRSGSMGNSINNAFDALYIIVESLKKQFGKDKVVEDVVARIFAFDMGFHEIKFGKRCQSDGGTMPFDELLNGIKEKTNDCMINVIITDAAFGGIDETKVEDLLNEIEGILIFITNEHSQQIENIANKHKASMYYILADQDFTINK